MGTLTSIPAHGLTTSHYDVVVIGGGINGTGIAADMAGRGLSVALFEADDLGCATSSASSKLLHGGLRYLEHYEFRLVREALAEREILLARAPYLARTRALSGAWLAVSLALSSPITPGLADPHRIVYL